MLEYVFFNDDPCDRFCEFASAKGLACVLERGSPELVVKIDEQLVDDPLADELDLYYDEMFALDQSLYEAANASAADDGHKAGVVVNLSDGRAVYAEVAPDLLTRIMSVIDQRDLAELVSAVVDAVEHPDDRTLCQRPG